jgi:hypothetical protein
MDEGANSSERQSTLIQRMVTNIFVVSPLIFIGYTLGFTKGSSKGYEWCLDRRSINLVETGTDVEGNNCIYLERNDKTKRYFVESKGSYKPLEEIILDMRGAITEETSKTRNAREGRIKNYEANVKRVFKERNK